MTVAVVVCALACAFLVFAEYAGHRPLRIAAKLTASVAFVLVGTRGLGGGAFGAWIFAGLVCGAIGDAALLGRTERAFLAGLAAFLAGHVLYVLAIATLAAPVSWLPLAGRLAFVPIAIGLAVLARLWPRLGGMRYPVALYVGAICAMVVGAIAVARGELLPEPRACTFAVGAALFFASDLAVARERFVERAFVNKALGLPAYYAGQLLVAWSAG